MLYIFVLESESSNQQTNQSTHQYIMEVTVHQLPEDVLLEIFSFLDAISLCKVRRVCQLWNRLSTDDILWKHKLLADVHNWKQVSNSSLPDSYIQDAEISKFDVYMRSSPEIQKWKKSVYQQTTIHQLSDMLRMFMPMKRYTFGVGASAMDSYGKGQSFFSKLLSFDAGNVFQHCGQFPGKFRGFGGGFQFKYKRCMLELCLMYVAPKSLRDAMTVEQQIEMLESKMTDGSYLQLLQTLHGYIHSIDTRILDGNSEQQTLTNLKKQAKEVELLNKHLKADTPLLILSSRKVESDPFISSYQVCQCLNLNSLSRPWMVSECSAQMIYRDIVDPVDWLISAVNTSS
ncbi:FBXO4 [Bugula neritina]|uniref:FBXO4 n=1 Tax=Bugula neritina TaxID=10212 RepID=A0A7J7JUZ6_BUGNE|nr:FBXO4 [Bugula neritina]